MRQPAMTTEANSAAWRVLRVNGGLLAEHGAPLWWSYLSSGSASRLEMSNSPAHHQSWRSAVCLCYGLLACMGEGAYLRIVGARESKQRERSETNRWLQWIIRSFASGLLINIC